LEEEMQLKSLPINALLYSAIASAGIAGCNGNSMISLIMDGGTDGGGDIIGASGQGGSNSVSKPKSKGGTGGKAGSSGNGGGAGSSGSMSSGSGGMGGGGAGGMGGSGGMDTGSGGMNGGSGGMDSGTGGTNGGTGGMGGDLSTYESMACTNCEAATTLANCADARMNCLQMAGMANAGPKAGDTKADLCLQLLTCVRRTGCVTKSMGQTDMTDCYCGTGVDSNDCFSGAVTPTGPCKDDVEAAAESTKLSDINNNFFDPMFATGALFNRTMGLLSCDARGCPFECKICTPAAGSGAQGDAMCHPASTGGGTGGTSGGTGGTSGGTGGTSGGTGGTSGGTGGTSGGTGGTSGTSMACTDCESMVHGTASNSMVCTVATGLCDSLTGTTTANAGDPSNGVPAIPGGVAFTDVCHNVIDCFHRTHCMGTDGLNNSDCFCGIGVDPNTCFSGTVAAATGPCKAEVLEGVNSVSLTDVSNRLTDNTFPTGVAVQMLRTCDHLYCMTECL
jgi:hypothetical protein